MGLPGAMVLRSRQGKIPNGLVGCSGLFHWIHCSFQKFNYSLSFYIEIESKLCTILCTI